MTLYMKLGGRRAFMQAMPRLQARLEQDSCFDSSKFRHEFEQSDDLSEFLIFLFGGAPYYEGKPVTKLLSPVCPSVETYQRFVDHLVAAFFDGRASDEEADLRNLMERLRPQVLNPKPVAPVLVYSAKRETLSA
ncbi:Clp protease ClpP [Labrenzia sp. OB1]|uniref:globin domain-containing protein n=1 Tax=Labrenzia sp. OB1 TaxID=1561204 RepID=UPI0007B21072|nr:Clp protease ClpP [Labrenzia sp. OB1]KZM48589.1 Clp protease ClpP [Labrenzia sp. OB1]